VAASFVVYLSVKTLNAPGWNAVFWIIMLFTSINAIAKSFIAETRGHNIYYHSLVSPQVLIVAKIVYNGILNIILSVICFIVYSILMGNPVENQLMYLLCVILGSLGFSSTFTMLSAIASKAGNSNLLMPVLSFPIIIPFLLVLIKACKKAVDGIDSSLIYSDLMVLALFNVLIIGMAYILFPFLWKE